MRMWRNWQTRKIQVLMVARLCRFKSCHPHQQKYPKNSGVFLSVFCKRVGGSRKPDGAAHTAPDTHTLKLPPDCRRVFVVRKTLLDIRTKITAGANHVYAETLSRRC